MVVKQLNDERVFGNKDYETSRNHAFVSFRKEMWLQVLPSNFCWVIDILISEHLDSLLGSQQIILLLYPLMTKLFGKIITLKR